MATTSAHLTRVHDGESLEDLKPWRVSTDAIHVYFMFFTFVYSSHSVLRARVVRQQSF